MITKVLHDHESSPDLAQLVRTGIAVGAAGGFMEVARPGPAAVMTRAVAWISMMR